jgi:hypothetical protein
MPSPSELDREEADVVSFLNKLEICMRHTICESSDLVLSRRTPAQTFVLWRRVRLRVLVMELLVGAGGVVRWSCEHQK